MSHVSRIELEISSLEDLKTACEDLGLQFLEGRRTYEWYGRWVGDYPLPEGMKAEDLGKCDHAVHVPGCTYEIGVIRNGTGWQLLWDFWHSGGLEKKLGKNAGKLKQSYAAVKIRNEAKKKRYRVTQKKTEQGIRIVLTGR